MYGFQAITHYNGWAMAAAGALIVMSGLALLAFIISLLPRLIGLFDKREADVPAAEIAGPAAALVPDRCPADINETARIVRQLSGEIGDEFELTELYRVCQKKSFPHPHLTIKCLREAGLIIPKSEGVFAWED